MSVGYLASSRTPPLKPHHSAIASFHPQQDGMLKARPERAVSQAGSEVRPRARASRAELRKQFAASLLSQSTPAIGPMMSRATHGTMPFARCSLRGPALYTPRTCTCPHSQQTQVRGAEQKTQSAGKPRESAGKERAERAGHLCLQWPGQVAPWTSIRRSIVARATIEDPELVPLVRQLEEQVRGSHPRQELTAVAVALERDPAGQANEIEAHRCDVFFGLTLAASYASSRA